MDNPKVRNATFYSPVIPEKVKYSVEGEDVRAEATGLVNVNFIRKYTDPEPTVIIRNLQTGRQHK